MGWVHSWTHQAQGQWSNRIVMRNTQLQHSHKKSCSCVYGGGERLKTRKHCISSLSLCEQRATSRRGWGLRLLNSFSGRPEIIPVLFSKLCLWINHLISLFLQLELYLSHLPPLPFKFSLLALWIYTINMYLLHIQKRYLNKQFYIYRMPWEKLNYFTLPAMASANEELCSPHFLVTFVTCWFQPFCRS